MYLQYMSGRLSITWIYIYTSPVDPENRIKLIIHDKKLKNLFSSYWK